MDSGAGNSRGYPPGGWYNTAWAADLTSDNHKKLLSYVDVLIDGEYDYTKKNLNRAWANSENQRIFKKDKRGEFYECKEE